MRPVFADDYHSHTYSLIKQEVQQLVTIPFWTNPGIRLQICLMGIMATLQKYLNFLNTC